MEDIEYSEDPDQNDESTDQKDKPEDTGNSAPTVEDAGTQSGTTANCAGDTFDYKEGNPIVSITFSLSKQNPFEVNVGTGVTSYKKSDKKAYPVLCEIRDFTTESKVKIESLKNKGCIEKNLPKVLAPILTQLNSLLLDPYSMYYDTKKYDDFVAAQSDFLKAPTEKPTKKGENEEEEEEEKEQEQEPQLTPEQEKRKLDLNEKVLGVVREGATQINEKDKDIIDKIKKISEKNGIGEVLQKFLIDLSAADEKTYSEMFPLHLLDYKYQGNEGQQLFMTNNGIITNGNVIFSYLNVDKQNKAISANFGGEVTMWTLNNEYQKALAALNGTQKDEGFIPDKLINEGFPAQGFPQKGGLGTRRRLSKKLFKKRTTRRNRK